MQLIIISGPSGSGKTTLSEIIINNIKDGLILNTDNYYKTGIVSKILSKVAQKNVIPAKLRLYHSYISFKTLNIVSKTTNVLALPT